METEIKSLNIELTDKNKEFITNRTKQYSELSDSKLNRYILNTYCKLLALLNVKKSK